eukprot:4203241-Prymnesium_polylepis.1
MADSQVSCTNVQCSPTLERDGQISRSNDRHDGGRANSTSEGYAAAAPRPPQPRLYHSAKCWHSRSHVRLDGVLQSL